jgi:hypothetical protein
MNYGNEQADRWTDVTISPAKPSDNFELTGDVEKESAIRSGSQRTLSGQLDLGGFQRR